MTRKALLSLFAAVPLYLAGDFFLFNGPLNRALQSAVLRSGVIASVSGRPITSSQLDRAVFEHLHLTGGATATFSDAEQLAIRKSVLDDLILHEILRGEIEATAHKINVSPAEIDDRLAVFTARFADKSQLETALKSQGIPTEAALRERIANRLRAEKLIASRTAVTVTDDEAKKWFTEHSKELVLPERVEARHIFLPVPGLPAEEAKKTIDEALARLTAKQKDFPSLAKELSQDPSTKDIGGNLGWITRARLSPDLAGPLFSLPEKQPAVLRSRIGWHLVEITGRKPSGPRTFEDAKPEIVTTLEAAKHRDAVKNLRETLRKSTAGVRILDPDLIP